MIRKPWTNGAGAYPELDNYTDLKEFTKRKRKKQMVIFTEHGDLLPVKCAKCKKPITTRSNRVDIYPKQKLVLPYHYECAWEVTFTALYKLADDLRDRGIAL